MAPKSTLALRLWRMRPWSTNPLMRGSHRCEALLRAFVVAGLLFMVPVAGAIGSTTYTRSAEHIQTDNAAKVRVPATAVTDATRVPSSSPYHSARYEATVRWTGGDTASTAAVDVDPATKAGAVVQIWVGPNGKPTRPPDQPDTAVLDGVGLGLMVLLLSGTSAIALLWVVELLLNSVHNRQWETEWRRVSRPIGT
ncbi:Rv1733c family protein [Nocardia concava]|uniref:Rv1733c family protein n=1 Tax=Nocardia concava TaxID=257281 RepID=UPI0002FFDD22|nr:hypothetical protein [Nocardia concava]